MKRMTMPLVALALLACLSSGALAQEDRLGKAVAPLFQDPQKVKEVSYTAWQAARDLGIRVAMEKSAMYLKKVSASENLTPAQAAPELFAAWWYNIAAQYWSEIKAARPGGEEFAAATREIKAARQDLEKALGWDAATAAKAFQDAYRVLQSYK